MGPLPRHLAAPPADPPHAHRLPDRLSDGKTGPGRLGPCSGLRSEVQGGLAGTQGSSL